jgi:hypothetical protein
VTKYRQKIEATPNSVLALCDCGWRELAKNKTAAYQKNKAHAVAAHGTKPAKANQAERQARRRLRQRGAE